MKRKKEEINVYVEKVSAKEIDGLYDTVDLCAQKYKDTKVQRRADELMREAQAAEKFEIHQLLFNGQPTGVARCTSQRCRGEMWSKKKKSVFQVNPYKTKDAKWQSMERHLIGYHSAAAKSDEAGTSAKKHSGPQQTKLNVITKKKIPQSLVEEMRSHNITVVSQRHTSLNFFSKEEVRARDQALLKAGGFDPDEVYKFDRTGPTVKKDLERNSEKHLALIAEIAPKLAEEGVFALALDHMEIKNMKNQKLVGINLQDGSSADAVRPKHALGIQLIICAKGKRHGYPLAYRAVAEKSNQATLRWARETLKESAK